MEAERKAVCSSPTAPAFVIMRDAPSTEQSRGGSLEMVMGGVWLVMTVMLMSKDGLDAAGTAMNKLNTAVTTRFCISDRMAVKGWRSASREDEK